MVSETGLGIPLSFGRVADRRAVVVGKHLQKFICPKCKFQIDVRILLHFRHRHYRRTDAPFTQLLAQSK